MPNSTTDRNGETLLFRIPRSRGEELPSELPLDLLVREREVIEALVERPQGEERQAFALDALRIGVLALRHATSRLDADLLRHETSQLLSNLGQQLEHYAHSSHERLHGSLKEYFDPQNGRFNERVQRLVAHDGELARLLAEQLDGDNSRLARTLVQHVGKESPLMKLLDPQQSEGLLATLSQVVEGQLSAQSTQVLKEFSLDNQDGALARLVRELSTKHGDLTKDLHTKIDEVVKEFSLDQENSALSRLVQNVDRAQRTISSEFSLDNDQSAFSRLNRMLEATQGAIHKSLTLDDEDSPLARLKRELLDLFGQAEKKNQEFQTQVRIALAEMASQRKEQEQSTRHGLVFEDAVYQVVAREAQSCGDIACPTGNAVGQIRNCKKGDCVIELGPDSPAPGEKIVIEAKQDRHYTLRRALDELQIARDNRGAQYGIFVFSKRLAPPELQEFKAYGNNIVVVWDADDPSTDIYLKAGMVTARALSFRSAAVSREQQSDFAAIDKAVLAIEKHASNLSQIQTSAQTIINSAEKIRERARIDEKAFETQLTLLREKLDEVRASIGCGEPSM